MRVSRKPNPRNVAKKQQGGLSIGPGEKYNPNKIIPPMEGLGSSYFMGDLDISNPPSFKDRLETNIYNKYARKADKLEERLSGGEVLDDMRSDAIRHAASAMYTTSGQGPLLAPFKSLYTNLLGVGHELEVGIRDGLYPKQTVSDLKNNYIGSLIGSLPLSIKKKEEIFEKAYKKGWLDIMSEDDYFKEYPEKNQQGGSMRINKKKTGKKELPMTLAPKFQFGGFPSIFSQDLDFSNYGDVQNALTSDPTVGSTFGRAFAQDNPDLIGQQFMQDLSGAIATNNNPLLTRDDPAFNGATLDQAAEDAAKRRTFLGIGKGRAKKKAEQELQGILDRRNTQITNDNLGTAGTLNYDISQGSNQANALINFLSNFQFQQGGSMSQLGYSNGSPFQNMPAIPINGNNITMASTGRPLMAYPNVGQPKLMQPYSGTHIFPEASQVVEVPIARKGGKMKKKKRLYQEGGVGAVGAQLEVGELFASTNADIFDTAALEKHSKMKKDKVTDVLAEGDYVFSALDRMKITRKEAEDMSFGLGGVLYKEGEIPKMPVEMTAADLLKEDEKEVKLTDYVDRIRKKYVIKDSDDVFDKKTNDFNRQSRGMYLSGAAVINEKKKKGEKSVGYASTFENPFAGDVTSMSNPMNSGTSDARAAAQMGPDEFQYGGVPHYQEGKGLNPLGIAMNAIPFLGGIIQGFGALGSARNNRRDIQNTLLRDRRDINQVAGSQSQYQGLSTAAALAGIAGQDPRVDAPNYDTTQLDASIRRVPRSLFDYQSARLAAASKPYMDQAFNNSGSFQQGVNAYAPVAAANAGSMANLGLQEVNQNIGLENQYRAQKQQYADRQMLGDVGARNDTRSNVNQLFAGAGSTLSGGIASQGNIESNRLNSLRNNNFQQTANTVNWRQAKNDAWSNIIGNTASGVQTMNNYGVFGNQPQVQGSDVSAATSRPGWVSPTMQRPDVQNPLGNLSVIPPLSPRIPYAPPSTQGYGDMGNYWYDFSTGTMIPK